MYKIPLASNLSGSSTQANTHLSLVAGTVFVDILGLDLTPFIGGSITILDSASKPLVLTLNASGTGETYGAEMFAVWVNQTYGTFTSVGKDITSAISAGAAGGYDQLTTVTGVLYRAAQTLTLNSGAAPHIELYKGDGTVPEFISSALSAGANVNYHTQVLGGAASYFIMVVTGATNYSSVNSFKQVLTPSVTGATASIVSKDAAFDPNSATGFTYSILTDNWNYRMGQQGFFKSS